MEALTLKNGTVEARVVVTSTMMNLEALLTENPIAFYELVQVCRNPEHRIFSQVQVKSLEELGLLSSGKVHNSIKNVVLSAVEGNGLDMTLGNPVAPKFV